MGQDEEKIKLQVGRTPPQALSMNEFAINDCQGELSCLFFSQSLNYVELKLTFLTSCDFFLGRKKDMIFKGLKCGSLIKTTLKLFIYASVLILLLWRELGKGQKTEIKRG